MPTRWEGTLDSCIDLTRFRRGISSLQGNKDLSVTLHDGVFKIRDHLREYKMFQFSLSEIKKIFVSPPLFILLARY